VTFDVQLETLEAKGLIRLAAVRPELEYLFRHALVQDAAYGSLLKQERRQLHGLVGGALEELFPDRREELAPVLAMHYEQAGDTDRAIDYLVDAGGHARSKNAIVEAYAAFDHAAELAATETPTTDLDDAEAKRRRRRAIEIAIGRAETGFSFKQMDASYAELEEIVPKAEELGDLEQLGRLHTLIALGRLQSGERADSPIVARSLRRIDEIGEALHDPFLRATPLGLVGMAQVFTGPVREGVAKLEEVLPVLESGPNTIGAAFARGSLAMGYATLGRFAEADAAAAHARELAEKGDLVAQLDSLIAESMVRSAEGQLDRAVPIAAECVRKSQETGASACVLASSWVLGDVFHRQGRFAEAKDVLRLGSDVSQAVDRRTWRPTLQAWLGSAAAALGEVPEADWDEVLATIRQSGNVMGESGILAKRGETLAAHGDLDAAVQDFAASAAILEEQGARPNLARVLRSWGGALRTAGRADEAEPLLRRSLGLLEELGLTREANDVRTALSVGGARIAFESREGER
jgi:tetratricopeptide (TPR) repeat protein